jgi:predicted ArsR family transcriptional regulator
MSRKPSPDKAGKNLSERRKVSKAETFGAVQSEFLTILKRRDVGTVDLIHERLDIHQSGRPAIGRAIADLKRQGLIERVDFGQTMRGIAHGRFVGVWRLTR